MKNVLIGLIKLYQAVRKYFPPVCRFNPSCSQYAILAIEKYGFWKGSLLAANRLSRCHPFNRGGYDPVK